ncbi:MAG TPA: TetR/AcrR family transcriptional regulator [Mycobacteriales bacterium]|jgi:AcrR family transcriptional regulator|nr:TetR/AcrR family transcriptional regulator [Mycobacteriales bacterium]
MTTVSRASAAPAPPDLMADNNYGPRHLEILDGLETIVLTEGFRDLTVGGLAERLRCSRRTLYEIADSKEGLVLIVIDRVMRRLARVARDAAAREETLLDQVRAYLTKGLTELHRATLSFTEDVAASPDAQLLVSSHFKYARSMVERMLVRGMETGEFREIHPRITAETFDAALMRLLDPELLRDAGVSFAEAVEEYLTLFTDGIRAPVRGTA